MTLAKEIQHKIKHQNENRNRLKAAGIPVSEATGAHGKRILVIG